MPPYIPVISPNLTETDFQFFRRSLSSKFVRKYPFKIHHTLNASLHYLV